MKKNDSLNRVWDEVKGRMSYKIIGEKDGWYGAEIMCTKNH